MYALENPFRIDNSHDDDYYPILSVGRIKPVSKVAQSRADVPAVGQHSFQTLFVLMTAHFDVVRSLSMAAVTTCIAGNLERRTLRPSRLATRLAKMMRCSGTPMSLIFSTAMVADPPVATIGSSTTTTVFGARNQYTLLRYATRNGYHKLTLSINVRRKFGVNVSRPRCLFVPLDQYLSKAERASNHFNLVRM